MPRGGKRPGAGAPKGNMNALKNGAYSKQGVYPERCASSSRRAQIGALFASDPKIREALLALAHKHNLRQHRANEVAALLFTRLLQRAEDVAAGRLPAHPERPPQRAVEGAEEIASGRVQPPISKLQHPARTADDGLNLRLPVDDLDSIKAAGALAAVRQIRSTIRSRNKKQKSPRHNQTPRITPEHQSNRGDQLY